METPPSPRDVRHSVSEGRFLGRLRARVRHLVEAIPVHGLPAIRTITRRARRGRAGAGRSSTAAGHPPAWPARVRRSTQNWRSVSTTPPTISAMSVTAKPVGEPVGLVCAGTPGRRGGPRRRVRRRSRGARPGGWSGTRSRAGAAPAPATPCGRRRRRRASTAIAPPTSSERAEQVEEEQQVPVGRADRGDHPAPGLKTISTRIATTQQEARVVEDERAPVADRAAELRRSGGRRRRRAARRARVPGAAPSGRAAERARDDPEHERGDDPAPPVAVAGLVRRARSRSTRMTSEPTATTATAGRVSPSRSAISLGPLAPHRRDVEDPRDDRAAKRRRTRRARGGAAASRTSSRREPMAARGLQSSGGRHRAAPPAADGDDRRGQLDARPPGGARARRQQGRGRARRGRLLRLPLRRARRRARAPRDARHARRGDDAPAEDAARRGDHRAPPRPSARR